MKGIIRAPETATSVGAMSNQGGAIISAHNPINGDVAIVRGAGTNRTRLVLSDNGYLYRCLNDSAFVMFDQGLPPWGGEQMAYIQPSQMEGFTVSEQANTIYMVRCGFCSISISGIAAPAGATLYITGLPPAKHRVEVPVIDLQGGQFVSLAYIDGGNTVIGLTPPASDIVAGYFSMLYPIDV